MKNAVIWVVLLSIAAAAEPAYKIPGIPDGETRKLKIYYENAQFNDAYFANKPTNQRMLHEEAAASIETVARFKGEGKARQLVYTRNEVLHNRAISVWEFTFQPGDSLILKSIDHKVKSPSGTQVRTEYYDLRDPIFNYPTDTFHAYILEVFFRSLEMKIGNRTQFHLWLAPKSILRMNILVDRMESLKLANGNVECFVLEMSPNLEDLLGKAGKIVQPLIPKYTFWLAKSGTHPVVKYRGPLGEMNFGQAPVEVHELLSITPAL